MYIARAVKIYNSRVTQVKDIKGSQGRAETRLSKKVELQEWTLAVLEVPVPGDGHQKSQLQWNKISYETCSYRMFYIVKV